MIIPKLSELGLPREFESWRPEQVELLEAALKHSITIAEAPPGVGKTLVGVGLQKVLDAPVVYITPNKSLQYQVCRQIPYARMIMGRNNYSCLRYPGRTAESCDSSKDDFCEYLDDCDYMSARAAAEASPLAVLNSTYYLYASNYAKRFRGGVLVVDEIDLLERAVLNFVNVALSERSLLKIEKMGGAPAPLSDDVSLWRSWAADTMSVLRTSIRKMPKEDRAYWDRLILKLKFLIDNADDSWFMEEEDEGVTFRPVRVSQYVSDLVWVYHKTVLAMSGTVLDSKSVADDVGLSDYHYVAVRCPFQVANRPVYDLSKYVGDLNAGNLVQSLDPIANLLKRILGGYRDGKVLVHTPSYWLAGVLRERLSGLYILSNFSDKDREAALGQFLGGAAPQVLISPSFSRGLDLYDDVYNCVIVTKVPWPDLGSEAVSRRLKMPGGQDWYMREAAAGLVQSCSRAVRSMDKQCDIYILDGAYKRLIPLLPKWFKDAIEVR